MSTSPEFVLFGHVHLLTLALILALCVWLGRVARRSDTHRLATMLAPVAVVLVVLELGKLAVAIGIYGYSWTHALPLDLCDVNSFLCAYMLVLRSYRTFEVAYFWTMGGSVTALLTPNLALGFPDPVFITFFLGHGLVVGAVVCGIFGYGFRPRPKSVVITLAVTALYAAIVGGLNVILGTNYMFLCEKPAGRSLLDFLGPWPIYLFGLAGVTVLVCWLCYLPFAVARRLHADGGGGTSR